MQGQAHSRRLNNLEQRFAALAETIPESPEKEAISVLHGIVQEVLRNLAPAGPRPQSTATALSLEDVAALHTRAPAMDGEAVSQPLAAGTDAPDFTLRDANDDPISLSQYRGTPVVLVFYPLDWSPTCSDQLSLYQSELAEFRKFGATILGISVDSMYSHGAWAAVRGITFPLLADFEPKGEVARRFNVYRQGDGFSERALYVVDGEGMVRYSHVSPRLNHVPDIYELYHALADVTGKPEPQLVAAAPTNNGSRST